MPRPDYPSTILKFQERFGTEKACRAYVFASRWPEGFLCPGCGAREPGGPIAALTTPAFSGCTG